MKNKDITKAIKALLRKWDRNGCSPMAINNGNCKNFALELCGILGLNRDKHVFWGDEIPEAFKDRSLAKMLIAHAFFCYASRYYDSECVKGVDYPDDLPFYQRVIECRENSLKRA